MWRRDIEDILESNQKADVTCALLNIMTASAVIECLHCLSVQDTMQPMVWPGQLHKPK
jgi:hypothetical protein